MNPNEPDRRLSLVRRMAWLCAALMLVTVVASAFIRLSQAGLGCADWPQCYGESTRRAARYTAAVASDDGAVAAARLAHRVAASVVLMLAIAMVLSTRMSKPVLRRAGRLAVGVLLLALALAVLGLATPGARVPAVAMGNLLGGFALLALCVRLATARTDAPHATPMLARAAVALLVLQVALGALVSASYAALSCSGLADCWATAAQAGWPLDALAPWQAPLIEPSSEPTVRVNPMGALAQLLHRAFALVLLAVLALWVLQAWQRGQRRDASIVGLLAVATPALALTAAATGQPLALVLLHNAAAALLLAALGRRI